MDGFELSNFTIDCNLTGTAAVACGAVRVMGSQVEIHRVKAIHWGNNISGKLGFVFAVLAGDPATNASTRHAGLEQCVALAPAATGSGTFGDMLVFHAGGKEHDATQKESYVRNCLVDGDQLGSGSDFR